MFERMLDHPLIDVAARRPTSADIKDRAFELADHIIYTGPIDEYFDFRFGKLPYRSLRFDHQTLDQEQFQEVAVVNYPSEEVPYTRISEYKHLTGQESPVTTITYEYPSAEGDPYYPIPRPENQELFKRYEALADATGGRDVRRPAGDLPLLQHGPDRRPGAGDVPADGREEEEQGAAATDSGRGGIMSAASPLELWGGVECTIVRLGDDYRDQVVETGHLRARDDIDRDGRARHQSGALSDPVGRRSLRSARPNSTSPGHDERLAMLRERGIKVIGGLVHHGSGPALHQPARPGVSRQARRLCRDGSRDRYPWIELGRRSTSR